MFYSSSSSSSFLLLSKQFEDVCSKVTHCAPSIFRSQHDVLRSYSGLDIPLEVFSLLLISWAVTEDVLSIPVCVKTDWWAVRTVFSFKSVQVCTEASVHGWKLCEVVIGFSMSYGDAPIAPCRWNPILPATQPLFISSRNPRFSSTCCH